MNWIADILVNSHRPFLIAEMSAETRPKASVRKVTTGRRVLLSCSVEHSLYQDIVRGYIPEFTAGDLAWGDHVSGTPFIRHNKKLYLQTIELTGGTDEYFLGNSLQKFDPSDLNIRPKSPLQKTFVSTYLVENVLSLQLELGEYDDTSPNLATAGGLVAVKLSG